MIAKLDRLTRSVGDWGHLVADHFGREAERPAALHSALDALDLTTASGRLFATIRIAFGQYERELTVERTQGAIDHKRTKGRAHRVSPLRVDARPGRAQEPRRPAARLDSGPGRAKVHTVDAGPAEAGWGDREIARGLDAANVPTKTGRGPWRPSAVAAILRRAEERKGEK